MKLLLLIACVIAASATAFAGKSVGNGADIVLCNPVTGRKPSLYDVIEADRTYGKSIRWPKASTVAAKVAELIARFDKLNPTRADLYRSWAATFFQEVHWDQDGTLPDIPDTGIGSIPNQCHLEQLVIQREPVFPIKYRYLIDKDLWEELDADHQAATVLHELILRESLAYGHMGSFEARYLNILVLSDEIEQMNLYDLFELLREYQFAFMDTGEGLPFSLRKYMRTASDGEYEWEDLTEFSSSLAKPELRTDKEIILYQSPVFPKEFKRHTILNGVELEIRFTHPALQAYRTPFAGEVHYDDERILYSWRPQKGIISVVKEGSQCGEAGGIRAKVGGAWYHYGSVFGMPGDFPLSRVCAADSALDCVTASSSGGTIARIELREEGSGKDRTGFMSTVLRSGAQTKLETEYSPSFDPFKGQTYKGLLNDRIRTHLELRVGPDFKGQLTYLSDALGTPRGTTQAVICSRSQK